MKRTAKKGVQTPSTATPTPAFAGTTHICFILDKSGSMGSQRAEAISGFNEFLHEQQKIKDDTRLTLLLFDTGFLTPIDNAKLDEAKEIGPRDYSPDGCTALFDAVGRGIARMEEHVKKGDRALVVILTDGLENSSTQITSHEQVRDIIKMKEQEGNWTFTYMGSGQNWQKEAAAMGTVVSNTTAYDPANARGSFVAVAAATSNYRSSMQAKSSNFYAPQPNIPQVHIPHQHPQPKVTTKRGNPFSAQASLAVSRDAADVAVNDLLKRAQKR
jgi:hypothetical protein